MLYSKLELHHFGCIGEILSTGNLDQQGTQPQPILVDEGITNAAPTLAPVVPTPASILADASVAQTVQTVQTATDSAGVVSVPQQTPLEQTAVQTQPQQQQQYPLTTTCVMYVGVPAGPCTCLPQYDPCAPNICCLKARYRSIKPHQNRIAFEPPTTEPSMVDMMMHVLKKIKTNLNHHRRR
ncbi:hypothetical protein WR25_05063 [Diploscapter pachys]|uniref:Uncharacterized protein n=1 Tax=Diploscapter pachys TaxID=2018661 RepID=A0A2A2K5J3_9BILA|nr:hypothetical protein WR25_05063 [Diploscapter pachys]